MKKEVLNRVKIQAVSRSANEAFLRSTAAAFVAQTDPTVDELSDIKTAVSEAVTNCIVHAYRDTLGIITMVCEILEGNCVRIRIKDNGCGIADIKKAMEPLYTTAPGEERAGLGFAVMESFMDHVRVSSHVGKGTTVVLEKKISSR